MDSPRRIKLAVGAACGLGLLALTASGKPSVPVPPMPASGPMMRADPAYEAPAPTPGAQPVRAATASNALIEVRDVLGEGSATINVADGFAGVVGVATATGDDPALKGPRGGGSGNALSGGGDWSSGPDWVVGGPEKKEVRLAGRVLDSSPEIASEDIDRAGLAKFVKARLKSIQTCYERELRRSPGLTGKIVVRFTIGSSGRVSEAEIDENTMGSDEVANCIRTTIKVWTTPFTPESDVPVSYPFVFTPAT